MFSTTTHFTKIFPKRADITGSPDQAFHMLKNRNKYYKYLIGGITIAPGGTFQYLYAPQVNHDLGGDPDGFVNNSSNKIGKFSCVYIRLVEATSAMNVLLKHIEVTPFLSEYLTYTRDLNSLTDPIRGTFLPNFLIVYFRQEIPQGSISSDKKRPPWPRWALDMLFGSRRFLKLSRTWRILTRSWTRFQRSRQSISR